MMEKHSLSPAMFDLSIYVFLNKYGLLKTLLANGMLQSIERFKIDEFLTGFNQAGNRYLMVDVGAGKEVADSKLKGKAASCGHLYSSYSWMTCS